MGNIVKDFLELLSEGDLAMKGLVGALSIAATLLAAFIAQGRKLDKFRAERDGERDEKEGWKNKHQDTTDKYEQLERQSLPLRDMANRIQALVRGIPPGSNFEGTVAAITQNLVQLNHYQSRIDQARNLQGIWKLDRGKVPVNPEVRAKFIAVANLKGGVGKTTVSANLAAKLADLGHRVLVVDLDWQTSLTRLCLTVQQAGSGANVDNGLPPVASALRAYGNPAVNPTWRTLPTYRDRGNPFEVVPTSLSLGLEEDSTLLEWFAGANADDARFCVGNFIKLHAGGYDYVILDCPPRFTLSLTGALAISDLVIMPITPDRLSLDGAKFFFSTPMKKVHHVLWADPATEVIKSPQFAMVANRCAHPEARVRQARQLVSDEVNRLREQNDFDLKVHGAVTAFKERVGYADAAVAHIDQIQMGVDRDNAIANEYAEFSAEVFDWLDPVAAPAQLV